ncbi:unnamed protein product [Eruca vesicaria subsp. sativa]|uniref:AtPDCT1/2 transmembrane domain-containing protein n=1 Tax=Eruca vesicaria subsp. sativa TaxID=29727 RepID=A0ABC8JLF0_ERUVS|nr:unnamed protein product [Eruca vesicaria subsp. sativa]
MSQMDISTRTDEGVWRSKPSFMTWRARDVVYVLRHHWIPCLFAAGFLFVVSVESSIKMVSDSSPPLDIGFVATRSLHRLLASSPDLNTGLAALNSVLGVMQVSYIALTWLIEGRPRATITALFLFTCRGVLGYCTQLPLSKEYLGSAIDFPLGNLSFFYFFSGHVAGTTIASLDMRRMQRWRLAMVFDILNVLQSIRLLATRGHYTIDLAGGVAAAILFDSLAGKYEANTRKRQL